MKNPFTWVGFAAILFWSFCTPLARSALERLPLFPCVAMQQAIALILLCIWTTVCGRSLRETLRPTWCKLAVAGLYLVYVILTNYLIGHADSHGTALAIALLICLWPVAALAIGARLFRRRLTAWFALGLVFTAIGGALVIGEGATSPAAFLGAFARNPLLLGGAVVAAGIWGLCSNLMQKWSAETLDFMPFNMALATLVLLTVSGREIIPLVAAVDLPPAFLALSACNAAGFLFWEIGLRKGHAQTIVIAAYFIPVTTAVVTAWYFSLPLTLTLGVAAVFVSVGALVSRFSVLPASEHASA